MFGLSWLVYYGQQQHWLSGASHSLQSNQPGLCVVDHLVDGDTIAVKMNGTVEKIWLIGVDTPETNKPNTPVQCYGPAAAAYTKSRIGSQRIRLEADSLSSNRDRFNRLLRYVYPPDGSNLDEAIIQNGYGFCYPYFRFTKSLQFATAQQQAMEANKGL